jgi:hypothetical protein
MPAVIRFLGYNPLPPSNGWATRLVQNLLHMDELLSRLKAAGTGLKVLEFPLIDSKGVCTWPAMYPPS